MKTVTKETTISLNEIHEIVPKKRSVAVKTDTLYLPYTDVLAIQQVNANIHIYDIKGKIIHRYSLGNLDLAEACFDLLAKNFIASLPNEDIYQFPQLVVRLKYIYGASLFDYQGNTIISLFDKNGYAVLSESGVDEDMFDDIKSLLFRPFYGYKSLMQLGRRCIIAYSIQPSVHKITAGILIKKQDKLIHFIPESDPERLSELFEEITSEFA